MSDDDGMMVHILMNTEVLKSNRVCLCGVYIYIKTVINMCTQKLLIK